MNKLQTKGLSKFKQVSTTQSIFLGIKLNEFIEEHENFFAMEYNTEVLPPIIILSGIATEQTIR